MASNRAVARDCRLAIGGGTVVRDSAIAYGALLRLCIFPTASDCRKPLTAHGYKDASNDPDEIERLWRGRPNANIAVATGRLSGVFVLDVDIKGSNGLRTLAELQAAHGPLPATWITATPTGGRHLWFKQPNRQLRNRVNFAPGLDIRTDGGSVAVPPSRRPDGAYTWEVRPSAIPLATAPEWLLSLIDPPPVPRPPVRPIPVGSLDRLARYAASAINDECHRLAGMAPNTGRNLQLFKSAANLGQLVGAGLVPLGMVEDALEAAAYDCGLLQEDGRHAVLASIKSGLTRGVAQPREVSL